MAATEFTAIYVNNEGKIIERKIPGMNTSVTLVIITNQGHYFNNIFIEPPL